MADVFLFPPEPVTSDIRLRPVGAAPVTPVTPVTFGLIRLRRVRGPLTMRR